MIAEICLDIIRIGATAMFVGFSFMMVSYFVSSACSVFKDNKKEK